MRRASSVGLAMAMLIGCHGAAPSPSRTSSLSEEPRLVAAGEASEAVMDQVPRTRVAFRFADGTEEPVDGEAIAFVERWREGAALIDPEGRVYEVRPGGQRRMLADHATGVLATDTERLAYVVARDVLGELRVHDGEREATVARDLASIGVVRVGEPILFVGAAPGGIVGVYEAGEGGARCLTNCALRTGSAGSGARSRAFVPPPGDPSLYEVSPSHVVWIDPDGARHEVAR